MSLYIVILTCSLSLFLENFDHQQASYHDCPVRTHGTSYVVGYPVLNCSKSYHVCHHLKGMFPHIAMIFDVTEHWQSSKG